MTRRSFRGFARERHRARDISHPHRSSGGGRHHRDREMWSHGIAGGQRQRRPGVCVLPFPEQATAKRQRCRKAARYIADPTRDGERRPDDAFRLVHSRQIDPRVAAEDRDVDERGFAAHPLAAGPGFVERGQRPLRLAPGEQRRRQCQQRVDDVSPVPATRETSDRLA
ncbi:MAG: hypothetical protein EXQ59_06175 [Acidobacteria bacterium]|nr:hypothetical protein [Acidobacteriota bacterium]